MRMPLAHALKLVARLVEIDASYPPPALDPYAHAGRVRSINTLPESCGRNAFALSITSTLIDGTRQKLQLLRKERDFTHSVLSDIHDLLAHALLRVKFGLDARKALGRGQDNRLTLCHVEPHSYSSTTYKSDERVRSNVQYQEANVSR